MALTQTTIKIFIMKKLFTPLLLVLTALFGGLNAKAADEVKELTKDMYYRWTGFDADAVRGDQATDADFNIGNDVELGGGGVVCGNGSVSKELYVDLTGSTKLIIEGTVGLPLRVLFNRQEDDSNKELNPKIGDDGTVEVDISQYPYFHLNTIKVDWGGSGKVNSIKYVKPADPLEFPKTQLKNELSTAKMYNAIAYTQGSYADLQSAIEAGETALSASDATEASLEAAKTAITGAINGLTIDTTNGYSELTAEMFKSYAVEGDENQIDLNNPKTTGCDYKLLEATGQPYGVSKVDERMWADLANYDMLYVAMAGNTTPRVMMNRLTKGGNEYEIIEGVNTYLGNMLEMNAGNGNKSTEDYLKYEDNVFTIDLRNIVDDHGIARLHAIKYPYNVTGIVTGIYLYTDPANAAGYNLSFNVDDPNHVVIKVNNEVKTLKAGDNTINVPDRATISIAPADKFRLKSVTSGGEDVALEKDGTFSKLIVKAISYKIETEVTDPLEMPRVELADAIEDAKVYDGVAKTAASYKALTDAIATAEDQMTSESATVASVNAAKAAIEDAIKGLKLAENYTHLTEDMFKKYASAAEPGEGEAADCAHKTFENSLVLYGDKNNSHLNWADLSDYDKLIVTVHGDNGPCFNINRTEENGKMLELNVKSPDSWPAEYHNAEGNVYTVNLKKIKKDHGVVRLHSIQNNEYEKQVFVTGMYLYKAPYKAVSAIALNKTEAKILVGGTETLVATIAPEDATVDTPTWSTSNPKVATVNAKGVVTALAEGEAIITAKADEKTASCTVTVKKATANYTLNYVVKDGDDEIILDTKTLTGNVDDEIKLTDAEKPELKDKNGLVYVWASDDSEDQTIDAGGTTVVTIIYKNKTAKYTLNYVDKENNTLKSNEKTGNVGGAIVLATNDLKAFTSADGTTYKCVQNDAADKKVTADGETVVTIVCEVTKGYILHYVEEGNESHVLLEVEKDAEVGTPIVLTAEEKGEITGQDDGIAYVYVKDDVNGRKVTEKADIVNISCKAITAKYTLNYVIDGKTVKTAEKTGKVGAAFTLADEDKTEIEYEGAKYVYKSNDGKDKKIDRNGTTVVNLTYVAKVISVTRIVLDKTVIETLEVGKSVQLKATVTPVDATNPTVTWTSSDESIATVDENGNVTAKGIGTVIITAKAGDKSASCTVNVDVAAAVDGFNMNDAPVQVYDLNGRYVANKVEGLEAGFYIVRQGNNAKKIRIR